MGGVARSPTARGIDATRRGHPLGFLVVILTEFRRARAAAQRYEDLRYRSARHGNMTPTEIPRCIFEEFYSCTKAVRPRDWAR